MLRSVMVFMTVAAVCALPVNAFAGDLDPPFDPFHPGSAMYTIEQIFDLLDTGQYSEPRTGPFEEPRFGPGEEPVDESLHTLDDIMKIAPMPPDINDDGATPGDVIAGKKYWGLRTDADGIYWGPMTGEGDITKLKAGNIRVGIAILGVEGSFNGIYCDPKNLSEGGRWCNNPNDGTVTDMTTGLVWPKNAGCLNQMTWADAIEAPYMDILKQECGVDDRAAWGDWRLPTKSELNSLTGGDEPVSDETPRKFSNVQNGSYWSMTTDITNPNDAYVVEMVLGNTITLPKSSNNYIWPVRRYTLINKAEEIPEDN